VDKRCGGTVLFDVLAHHFLLHMFEFALKVLRVLNDRQVSIEEGDTKARELNVNFIETSAKAGLNIKVSVIASAARCYDHSPRHSYSDISTSLFINSRHCFGR